MPGNPTLNENTFSKVTVYGSAQTMTVQGAVNKTAILLGIAAFTGTFTWRAGQEGIGLAVIGSILGLIFALITCFKMTWAPVTAPIYAACEGLFLGGISVIMNKAYPGIALQAAILTGATLAAMLGAYTTGMIRATERFKKIVIAATFGIFVFYMLTWILGMFGFTFPSIRGSGMLSIGISVVICAVAALNLIIDFDVIEQGAAYGAPKYMEWYGAFGLMVTLVWLYVELLRLLAKLRDR